MKRFLAAAFVSLMLVSGGAFALPSATQIETAMQQGNWQQADAGLTQVLQAHPNNARAHYLYAQVLDREGRYTDALTHLQQAKTLDPQVRFTDPSRFLQTEARLRKDAQRAGATTSNGATNPFVQQNAPAAQTQQTTMMQPVTPKRQGVSMGMLIGIVLVIVAIAFVLRWTLKRARSNDDSRVEGDRREQLKRATELLNAVRSLKLDVRLSTVPGHEALEKEVEGAETQLRQLVETLSNSQNPVPPYQIEDLARQVESLKARSEGRPDPNATGAAALGPGPLGSGESTYAREADERFGRQQAPYPYPPQPAPQQQPPVIVQQGGGFGGGMGGLLTGVLLGQVLNSGGRERVIERDVIVDPDEARRRAAGGDVDFGQGSNDWSDGNGGGGIDMGSSDDSGGWTDT